MSYWESRTSETDSEDQDRNESYDEFDNDSVLTEISMISYDYWGYQTLYAPLPLKSKVWL